MLKTVDHSSNGCCPLVPVEDLEPNGIYWFLILEYPLSLQKQQENQKLLRANN